MSHDPTDGFKIYLFNVKSIDDSEKTEQKDNNNTTNNATGQKITRLMQAMTVVVTMITHK